jgi:hypothetical protein
MKAGKIVQGQLRSIIAFWRSSPPQILFLLTLAGVLYFFHTLPYINILVPMSYLFMVWWLSVIIVFRLNSRYTVGVSALALVMVALSLSLGWGNFGTVMAEFGYYALILAFLQSSYDGKKVPTR